MTNDLRGLVERVDELMAHSTIYGPADALRETWGKLRVALLDAQEAKPQEQYNAKMRAYLTLTERQVEQVQNALEGWDGIDPKLDGERRCAAFEMIQAAVGQDATEEPHD